jgi:molybdopterin-guanine dinucleotide biosynthesis protein A
MGGIVLCGGESRRMGSPKALLPFGPETMLERIVRILEGSLSPMVVVSAPEQKIPDLPSSIRRVQDDIPGRGPVQGLVSGLGALEAEVDAAFVCSCDLPLLTSDLIAHLVELALPGMLTIPEIEGRRQPLCAVYPVNALGTLEQMLAESCFRLSAIADRVPARVIQEDEFLSVDPQLHCFTNVNSEDTYREALALAGLG